VVHDRNPRLLDQNPRTLIHPYTESLGLDSTLGPRDYESVPWADEDEDMASVKVGVEGRRSLVGCRRRGGVNPLALVPL
jgi:hypothetical protein